MLIQSKRVWIADQFIPAQIEIDDNKIVNIARFYRYPVSWSIWI